MEDGAMDLQHPHHLADGRAQANLPIMGGLPNRCLRN
jgi:hypothetical protein